MTDLTQEFTEIQRLAKEAYKYTVRHNENFFRTKKQLIGLKKQHSIGLEWSEFLILNNIHRLPA